MTSYPDSHRFNLEILAQPDDTTCGPTCLHAVYSYYDDPIDLNQLIKEVHAFEGGGTLAVWLACHALKRGYKASIYTYNLQVFDPTWFANGNLSERLQQQMVAKKDPKLHQATRAYLEFLELGGKLKFEDLTRDLIRRYLTQNIPILTGLSSTFLYRAARECEEKADDILGEPAGHFVVLSGYDRVKKTVEIADPLPSTRNYEVSLDRVINAILLGILTYDANFLIIRKE